MSKFKKQAATVAWAIKLAMKFNPKTYILWSVTGILLSLLPAVSLYFNREVISVISNFLATGQGSFRDVLPSLITLGIILTIMGVSGRVNDGFLKMVMHTHYYYSFLEYIMDTTQDIELKTLMNKKYQDGLFATIGRGGSLSDFMAGSCFFVSQIIGLVAILLVAAQTSWVIFFAAIGYVVLAMAISYVTAAKTRWDWQVYEEVNRLSHYYQEAAMQPGVAKETRVYETAKENIEKWEKANEKVVAYDKRMQNVYQIMDLISSAGFYVFMVGVMVYSIFQVAAGDMAVDVFLMLYALAGNISNVSRGLSGSIMGLEDALFNLNRQREFIQSVPRSEIDTADGFKPLDEYTVFSAKNMCFSYDDQTPVLHNLNFDIKKGETIALVGHNGSGKSTLVKLLIGLFAPTGGELKFYGRSYEPKTRGGIIRRTGMFFQDFHIFHATFRENVGFGNLKNIDQDEQIHDAIEKGGATKILKRFEQGLDQWLQKHVKKDGVWLSGGENQRIAVSRAHMSNKEILIFDEPAAALDPIAEMEQFQAIHQKIQGSTAILISHRVGFARLADRILVMDGGRLVEDGTHEELIAKNGVYANFFSEQAQWYVKEEKQQQHEGGNHE